MKHLVLVDGHHLMYRAYYAIPRTMQTSKGEQTNAIFGVASMIIAFLKAEEPDSLIFCFDAGEETFRHQENATYKEGRAETPDEFFLQIPRIVQMIEAFGFRHVSDPRYEADDFLCAYAKAGEKADMKVTIITGDRDALQLASEHVRIAIPHKGYQAPEYLGPSEILAKYGVRPDQVPSYKGLVGDASDNLPGVIGIGPKTAASLLQKYDSLAGLYEHVEEVASATVRQKLMKDREQAFFCEHMATLVCDMPLPVSLDEAVLKELPTENIVQTFRAFEFGSLIKRLDQMRGTAYGKRVFQESQSPVPQQMGTAQMSLFT